MRRKIELCDPNTAMFFITGTIFLIVRVTSTQTIFSGSSVSSQAIEGVSLVAKDKDGEILLPASYDNKERYSATKLAREFGSALADKPT